jgi:hypothetical protein
MTKNPIQNWRKMSQKKCKILTKIRINKLPKIRKFRKKKNLMIVDIRKLLRKRRQIPKIKRSNYLL